MTFANEITITPTDEKGIEMAANQIIAAINTGETSLEKIEEIFSSLKKIHEKVLEQCIHTNQ